MRIVDEIAYLSDKGYEFMSQQDFILAEVYFKDAASKTLTLLKKQNHENHEDIEYIANSLLTLAREAGQQNYEVVKTIKISDLPILEPPRIKKQTSKKKHKSAKPINNVPINIHLGMSPESGGIINWDPVKLMNGIMTITGGSGSGKTETLKALANNLISNNIPCIVFDIHGDIETNTPTISLDYQGHYSINPLELTSKSKEDGGPLPHINRILNQFSYALKNGFSPSQNSWVRNLLKFSYYDHGIIQEDPSSWERQPPDFKYLLNLIQKPDEKILTSENQEFIRLLDLFKPTTRLAVENRLAPILEHPAFSGDNPIPIDEIITKSSRILLKPLNTIDMQFIAADTIMRQIFAFLQSMGHISDKGNKFRSFILIDEVKILTGFKGKMNDPYHILNRLATEARKFGLGLILASQIFSHFGRDIRSNSATKIILRTMDLDETKRCAKELKIDMKKLSSINRPGEGYIITSEVPNARHIQLFTSDC